MTHQLRNILAIVWLLFALPVSADVAIVGTPHTAQGNSGTASTSGTIPSATGLVAYIGVFVGGGGPAVSSMATFGGVAPVLVATNNDLRLYRVVNPSPGAATAQATLTAPSFWSIHVIYVSGVDTGVPDDTPVVFDNSETLSIPVTVTSAVDDLVIAFGIIVMNTIIATDGATLSTAQPSIDGGYFSSAIVYEAGAPSVTVGIAPDGGDATLSDNFIIGMNINAASGGGSSPLLKIMQQLEN